MRNPCSQSAYYSGDLALPAWPTRVSPQGGWWPLVRRLGHGLHRRRLADRDTAITRAFWLLAVAHLVLWTVIPLATQPNAPLDAVEMLYWGREWELGYYKHPPLPAWVAALSCRYLGTAVWPTYLLAQLCVTVCLWAVWRLARRVLQPSLALCSVFLLEAAHYYNFSATEFNNNTLSRMFWALAIVCFYRAVVTGHWRAGWTTGACLGLGLLSKYDTAVLAATMCGFCIWEPRARRVWKSPAPYVAVVTAAAICLPHAIWLWMHQFPTLQYLAERAEHAPTWWSHLTNPLAFAAAQLAAVVPMLLVARPLLRTGRLPVEHRPAARFARRFLVAMAGGPFVLVLLGGLATGAHLRSMWGSPLWTFFPLALLAWRGRSGPGGWQRVMRRCLWASLLLAAALSARNVLAPYLRQRPSRIHFPGQQVAAEAQRRWNQFQRGSVPIVGGPWWLAANAAQYLPHHPQVFGDLDSGKSPWINDAQLRRRGAVLMWEVEPGKPLQVPQELERRFGPLMSAETVVLQWQTGAVVPPLRLAFALIEPAAHRTAVAQHNSPTRTGDRARGIIAHSFRPGCAGAAPAWLQAPTTAYSLRNSSSSSSRR